LLRVLHGPVNVGNQPWVLSRHERALGVKSDLVVSYGTWLQYPADRVLNQGSDSTTWRGLLRRAIFGLGAPFRYDVIHYYFGRSFMSEPPGPKVLQGFQDLRLARRLGKKVFMTLQGCDVRLSDRNADRNAITMCRRGHCTLADTCRNTTDKVRRKLIETILPLCNRVFVLNPDLAHDVPGATFLPYCSVDIESFHPTWPKTEGPIRILHAPSDEAIKGTRYLVEAVERLKTRWPIELILVKGLPYTEALKHYVSADLVVDQLLAGWYGGFAVEMMALGKPVACYLRANDLQHVPPAMRHELPLKRIEVPSLEADLEALLHRRSEWPRWGRDSHAFVHRWHHPRRIAKAMVRAYTQANSEIEFDSPHVEDVPCAA
jgi:hypothetical protein